jgi:hypothetical protein
LEVEMMMMKEKMKVKKKDSKFPPSEIVDY